MPIYYWKRTNPGRILVPAFRDSEYLSDDLKDLAGCLLRRARKITDMEFDLRSAIAVFQKLQPYLEWLRCTELLLSVPVTSEQYARLQAQALEWERAYLAAPLEDKWWALLSAARARRPRRTKEDVAKPPTLDEVRANLAHQRAAEASAALAAQPASSAAGTPQGLAHRDPARVEPTGTATDPAWHKDEE